MSKKKTQKDKVLLVGVLDRSGSMSSVKAELEDAWKELVKDQREGEGELRVSLYQFDYGIQFSIHSDPNRKPQGMRYEIVFRDRDIHDPGVEIITIVPRGLTPLRDAIGRTILDTDAIANGRKVVVVILTDGLENRSEEFSQQQIRTMISDRERLGWTFVFLGAGLESAAQAKDYHIPAAMTVDYVETRNAGQTVASVSSYVTRGRAGGQSVWQSGLNEEERAQARGESAPGN
jgi:Mg-chelatase subunit ChlD